MIAAITAGGRVEGELASAIGTSVKALARVGGVTLLDASIAAAHGAGARRIVVVGGTEVEAHCAGRVERVVEASSDGRENLRRAIEEGHSEDLLLLTSDMPFADAAAVEAFLAGAHGADAALPLASARDYEATYPGAPPHLTRLGRDRVANGSVVYFGPGIAPRVLDVAQRLFDARKSLFRMATLLGPVLLARFALGQLRIEHIESRAQKVLGIRARAVRDASPALCFDIDTMDDYRYAVAYAAR